jgi:glycosyltransferase involved in cell wall biosynthesis
VGIRVLQAMASLDQGGAEAVVMGWLRAIDSERVQFDFVVNQREKPYYYEDEVRALGGRIFKLPRMTPLNVGFYALSWYRLLRQHPEWRLIHGHHTSPAPVYFSVAKLLGRTVWSHSHNAGVEPSLKGLGKRLSHLALPVLSDKLLACSALAAQSMFGGASDRALVLPNPIDVVAYRFDPRDRERLRDHFAIPQSAFVVGHVGRFANQKNHTFLVDAFARLASDVSEARLLLIGTGPCEPAVRDQVASLGLSNRVVITGGRSDVGPCLAAMDVFVMPSLYEGFPVALVEAQASGLPALISDSVTSEAALTDNVEYLPLSLGPAGWAERIAAWRGTESDRASCADRVRDAGFDTSSATEQLATMYEEAVRPG